MGSIFGGITDAIGLTNYGAEEDAANRAAAAGDRSYALAQEQIKFAREQYADWKAVYGDIQTNLGEYYKTLGPEKLTAMGLQNQQREYQSAQRETEKMFAQKGLSGSGAELALKTAATFQNAEKRADIRTTAEQKVNEQKMQFLALGLGQGATMMGAVTNAYNTGVNSQADLTNTYSGVQTKFGLQNMDAAGTLFGQATGYIGA